MIQKPLIIPLSDYLLYGHFHPGIIRKEGKPYGPLLFTSISSSHWKDRIHPSIHNIYRLLVQIL